MSIMHFTKTLFGMYNLTSLSFFRYVKLIWFENQLWFTLSM